MKSKLVKYPFNDGKRYRWDTFKMGKRFEYTWEQSEPNNFNTITPYIKTEEFDNDPNATYGVIDLTSNSNGLQPFECPAPSVDDNQRAGMWLWKHRSFVEHKWWVYIQKDNNISGEFETERTAVYYAKTPGINNPYVKSRSIQYHIGDTLPPLNDNEAFVIFYAKAKNGSYAHETAPTTYAWWHYDSNANNPSWRYNFKILEIHDWGGSGNQERFNYADLGLSIDQFNFLYDKKDGNLLMNYLIEHNQLSKLQTAKYPLLRRIFSPTYDINQWYSVKTYQDTEYPRRSIELYYNTDFCYTTWSGARGPRSESGIETIDKADYKDRSWRFWDYANNGIEYTGNGRYSGFYNDAYSMYPNIIRDISGKYYPLPYRDAPDPPINWYYNCTEYITSDLYFDLTDIELVDKIIILDDYQFSIPGKNKKLLVKTSDWNISNTENAISNTELSLALSPFYYIKPIIKLIGDQTSIELSIPNGNTSILSYTLGEPTDKQHLNPKSLQLWAPCEYDVQGNVISRTWLTFNSYTQQEWLNGYHFLGNQWNNIGSPWAYAGNMTAQGEHKMTVIGYEPCESGTYTNVLEIIDQTDTIIEDTLGTIFSSGSQTYYDNVGDLYFFDDDVVKSNDRHAYPDHGYQGRYMYILKPEETKFITYTNSTTETLNVELDKNRYLYTHDNAYFNRDTSLYGKVIGTTTSTNEESIPDASWRKYLGLYLGESIPFLGIVETNIPESQILGVPAYDKQVNTSETLKYGTVAAASLTFTVNLPVEDAMLYNNEYLILYYDFTHLDEWKRMGFFYVDSIESIDENSSRITAHDETYKLNKYVDDFLENYSGEVTLGKFYHDLLDYCDCYYDTKEAEWRHYKLNNVYHAIKTTGIEVAHFVAAIAPGFIHTNIDGDIVLEQYEDTSYSVGINDYSDLQYTAYNSDLLNKVRITSNNVVVGEDTYNYGSNIYFVSDNPLINTLDAETTLNSLANTILNAYRNIPAYRPAEIQFLVLPKPTIGDIFSVSTLGGDTYKVIAMGLSVDASGVKIKSLGTQTYPVEAQSNSQFINIINDIDSVSADVDNLENAQQILGQAINENKENIETLDGRVDTAESDISTLSTGLSTVSTNLQNKINNDSISQSNNLVSIKINGTPVSNITNKTYVDNSISSAISNSEAKNRVAEANNLVSVKINNNEVNDIAKKGYVDGLVSVNTVFKVGTLNYRRNTTNYSEFVAYMGKSDMSAGIFVPLTYTGGGASGSYFLWRVYNGTYSMLWDNGAGVYWINLPSGSFTEQ